MYNLFRMSWRAKTFYKIAGSALIVVAGIGFLTVADEFRHTGELAGVTGILVAGIAVALAGFVPRISSTVALQWVAPGVALGLFIGAVMDRAVLAVTGGVIFGLALAFLLHRRAS